MLSCYWIYWYEPFFLYTFSFLLLFHQTYIAFFNNALHEFKILKKLIITETFNIGFHDKFIKFGLFSFSQLFFILSDLMSLFTFTYICVMFYLQHLCTSNVVHIALRILSRNIHEFSWHTHKIIASHISLSRLA